MYFATSYHFTLLDGFGNIESTDTWVVKNDSKKNRELTKDWFKRFIKLSEKEYVGDTVRLPLCVCKGTQRFSVTFYVLDHL